VHGEAEVRPVAGAVPERVRVDVEMRIAVEEYLRPARGRRVDRGDAPARRFVEPEVLVDAVAALVDEPVVAWAEEDEVRQARLAASRPVAYVMGVDESLVSQPGKRQRRSRAASARRMDGGTDRVLRPTFSSLPLLWRMWTTDASQASLRAVSGEIAAPSWRTQGPSSCASAWSSTWTTTW
jgi:hypothetical protein